MICYYMYAMWHRQQGGLRALRVGAEVAEQAAARGRRDLARAGAGRRAGRRGGGREGDSAPAHAPRDAVASPKRPRALRKPTQIGVGRAVPHVRAKADRYCERKCVSMCVSGFGTLPRRIPASARPRHALVMRAMIMAMIRAVGGGARCCRLGSLAAGMG